jgi:hypothetical protein
MMRKSSFSSLEGQVLWLTNHPSAPASLNFWTSLSGSSFVTTPQLHLTKPHPRLTSTLPDSRRRFSDVPW